MVQAKAWPLLTPTALAEGECESCGRPRHLVRIALGPPGEVPTFLVCQECAADAVEHLPGTTWEVVYEGAA